MEGRRLLSTAEQTALRHTVAFCVFITNWSHLTLNGTDNHCRCTASLMLMSAVRWQRQQRQQLTLTVKFFFKVLQCCCLVEALSVSMFQVQHLFIYPSLSLSTVQSRSTVCLTVCVCVTALKLFHTMIETQWPIARIVFTA